MLVLRHLVALGCSVIMLVAMLTATSGSRWTFLPASLIALAAAVFGAWHVVGKESSRSDRVMFVVPAFSASLGALGLLLFIEQPFTRFALVIGLALLLSAYLTHLFFFLHVPTRYSPHALESVSSFLQLFAVFALATTVFGLALFTEIPIAVLLLPFLLLSGMMMYQALWVAKVMPDRARLLSGIGALLLTELAAACAFLPTSFYVNGAVIALAAYVMHFHFRVSPFDPHFLKTARRATMLACGLVITLFISAPWR